MIVKSVSVSTQRELKNITMSLPPAGRASVGSISVMGGMPEDLTSNGSRELFLLATAQVSAIALVIALVVGTASAIMSLSSFTWLRRISAGYIAIIRSTPAKVSSVVT